MTDVFRAPPWRFFVQTLLANADTKLLWSYFVELSKIPRGSKNEAEVSAWVAAQGRALGLETETDAVGNVLIRKPATPGREQRPVIALQAHMDMVCEQNEGTGHDFTKDPIKLVVDGDKLRASGTTLGADNGIGVCAALAVLASQGLQHGPVEVLITVDEETGLTGAQNIRAGWLRAKYLLNLDSEEEGILTIGCAGGVDSIATRGLSRLPQRAGTKPYRVKVSGLKGGHSGIDINAGRGNANRILAQILAALTADFRFELAAFKGGNKRNAIAREANAQIHLDPAQEAAFKAALAAHQTHWRAALGAFDPNLAVSLEPGTAGPAMSAQDQDALLHLLLAAPHGVEAMSPDIKGLVQTSTNLGVVETSDAEATVNLLTRSSVDASKAALAVRILAACAACGFRHELSGGYPGWKPEPNATLVKFVNEVHQIAFGKPMDVVAIHAGLECGLIGEKYPDMEMVSFGPDMWDVHTPDEHVSIPSVANFWKFLTAVLAQG
jgi:dipeptidase D